VPVTLPMHGACTRGGFRSGDVLKPSRGVGVDRFSQSQTYGAQPRLRDMFNPPYGSMSCYLVLLH
jgi:hypothetical protein